MARILSAQRDVGHYRNLLRENRGAGIGFALAASAVYAATYGYCEAADHATAEWRTIARRLRATYGDQLCVADVLAEMDAANCGAGDAA